MKGLKWLVCIPLLAFVGCANQPSWANTTLPTSEPVTTTSKPITDEPIPPMYANWLKPSKVTISNFHAGAVAEYPITFHNAKQTTTEQKRVTTEDKETIAEIPISSAGLYQNDIKNVIEILSDNPKEDLRVNAYDSKTNGLMISGFIPNTTRIMTITYKPMTAYQVYFKLPDTYAPKDSARIAQNWVLVANPTLVMSPLETTDDMVSISMPSDAKLPDKNWEFWIGVSEITNTGGTQVSVELVSRWVVNMKG